MAKNRIIVHMNEANIFNHFNKNKKINKGHSRHGGACDQCTININNFYNRRDDKYKFKNISKLSKYIAQYIDIYHDYETKEFYDILSLVEHIDLNLDKENLVIYTNANGVLKINGYENCIKFIHKHKHKKINCNLINKRRKRCVK